MVFCFQNSTANEGVGILADDSELFSTVYHKLVHSPALETILKVEHSYSRLTQDIIYARDQDLADLSTKFVHLFALKCVCIVDMCLYAST